MLKTPKLSFNKKTYLAKAKTLKVKLLEMEQVFLEPIGFSKKSSLAVLFEKITHFFIPHKKNNYHPRIFHPLRLTLYAVAAITIKFIMVGAVISYPMEAMLMDDAAIDQQNTLVRTINEQRTSAGSKELAENNLLNHAAYLRAQELVLKSSLDQAKIKYTGISEYLNGVNYRYQTVAENIATNFFDPETAVRSWMNDDGRKADLLDKNSDEIGAGIAYGGPAGKEQLVYVVITAQKMTASENENEGSPAVDQAIAIGGSRNILTSTTTDPAFLIEPTITNLESKTIFRDGNLDLKISAPQADIITLYVDNEEKILKSIYARSGSEAESSFNTNISLSEGQHYILVKAAKGKYELYSKNYIVNIDYTPPAASEEDTRMVLSNSSEDNELTFDINASLSSDTAWAKVLLGNYQIPLYRIAENANQFIGSFVISKNDQALLVEMKKNAILLAEDEAGNSIALNFGAAGNDSLVNKYKNNSAVLSSNRSLMNTILGSGLLFYKTLLLISALALMLNIFIEIHVQRPRVIFSACGLILLLGALIII